MARSTLAFVALALVLCFVACSKSSDGGSSAEAGVPAGTTFSLSIGPITVQPGEENTQCIVLPLGNAQSIHVGQIHNVLTEGSHHMIVYRSADTTPQTTPFDCIPFTDTLDPTKGSTLMITQKKDDTLTLPSGVAFTLDPNQMIRIELHYINPSAQVLEVTGTTTFITMDDAQYQNEADFLFIGDPDITIPPNSTTTLGPVFFALPPEYAGSQFFAITGHEHQLGTDVTISIATGADDPGTSIYDIPDWSWSDPVTVTSDPPFTVPTNGGFRFTCNWTNTTANTVSFGESATDEMCFFWAYYYPSQGARVCMHTDQNPSGAGPLDLCCPGPSLICDLIVSKLDSDAGPSGSGPLHHDAGADGGVPASESDAAGD
jgi:hypothetical protein